MKEKKYWADAELSALLEELGCESFLGNMGSWAISAIDFTPTQKLFHFSDILLPPNSTKVFGRGIDGKSALDRMLLYIQVSPEGDTFWQSIVKEECRKSLKK